MASNTTWLSVVWKELGIKAVIRSFFDAYIRERYYQYCLQKRGQVSEQRLLIREADGWKKNREIIEAYQGIMRMEEVKEETLDYANAVLNNTDNLYENGRLRNETELKIYQALCQHLKRSEARRVWK